MQHVDTSSKEAPQASTLLFTCVDGAERNSALSIKSEFSAKIYSCIPWAIKIQYIKRKYNLEKILFKNRIL
jgi:hypothetical protein